MQHVKATFIFLVLLIPSLSWGGCFSDAINKLANSGKTYKAKVITNKRLSDSTCKLRLNISGTNISGEAKGRLCRASRNKFVKVNIHNFCCNTPPCSNNQKTKIWFTEPKLAIRSAKMAKQTFNKSALKKRPPATGVGSISATKKPQAETRRRIIQNKAQIASGKSIAIGESASGTASTAVKPAAKKSSGKARMLPPTPAEAPVVLASSLDHYKVELGVDGEIYKPGPPGQLKVWIGDPALSAGFNEDMAKAETTIAARGQFGKVTPNAPDFVVEPKESICIQIDPTGSEVPFSITPKHTGTFNVGASVLLYKNELCKGAPIPKSAADLEVAVKVNPQGLLKYYLLQLWDVLWEGILDFWKWLVATAFALFIFLIRKRLKKVFGFDA